MTNEELMMPRYEVISTYPNSVWGVGEVLLADSEADCWVLGDNGHPIYLSKYPHIFRKMKWWNKRNDEDFPKYVKNKEGVVRRFMKVHFEFTFLLYDNPGEKEEEELILQGTRDREYKNYNPEDWNPATEEDYNHYINSLK